MTQAAMLQIEGLEEVDEVRQMALDIHVRQEALHVTTLLLNGIHVRRAIA